MRRLLLLWLASGLVGCNLLTSFDPTTSEALVQCNDTLDNDGDGQADCADPDCTGTPACATPEVCDNDLDDDADGDTDCDDADCSKEPGCQIPAEVCDNKADDDGDGLADCADPDCAKDPACGPFCGDGIRNADEFCDGNDLGGQDCTTLSAGFVGGELSCDGGCKFDTSACIAPNCGDGNENPGEGCDDGNNTDGDGCSAACVVEFCGDGIENNNLGKGGFEQCDDGNNTDGDGCNSFCRDEVCGDGTVNNAGAESCDDGNIDDNDGCSATCEIEFCGDGVVNNGEECDDSNTSDNDGCSAACVLEFCGDGIQQSNEQCDDANNLNNDGCNAVCVVEFCGDGILNNGEQCDDSNTSNGDGCSAVCVLEFCGDGAVNNAGLETCDDGNNTPGDGCDEFCVLEFCGDGVVNNGEECDDSNTSDNDGCSATCVLEFCGDGIQQSNEQCDDANNFNNDGCNAVCVVEFCGDGTQQANEQCDDTNSDNGDGCDEFCVLEFCGDGILNNNESEGCDDGNNTPGDGCDENCGVETGFLCLGQPSACSTICGDGLVLGGEQCDDGNTQSGDGCDAVCIDEFCGDNLINDLSGNAPLSVEYIWLATSCDGPRNIRFSSNGALVLETEGDPGTCSCTPGIRSQTVTDPAALAAFTNGPNGFLVDFSDGSGNSLLAWAVARVSTVTGTQEFVLFDLDPVGDAENRNPDLCASNFTGSVVNSTVADLALLAQETCDDGNNIPGDGCSDFCQIEVCGDGAINNNGTEQCDDGNTTPDDGCDANCLLPICGDGIADITEPCDDGNNDDNDGCSSLCQIEVCGDGITNAFFDGETIVTETCDDGNNIPNDGCNNICQTEFGFTCVGEPSLCASTCGDGLTASDEACDDGNGDDTDGCTTQCINGVVCKAEAFPGTPLENGLFIVDPATGHCYVGANLPQSWLEAETLCEQNGGTLAVPDEAAENALILNVRPNIEEMWIGINDLTTEAGTDGTLFQKVTGGLLSFVNFTAGEPNSAGDEDCVHYVFNGDTWNDFPCGNSISNFVCEFNPAEVFATEFIQGQNTVEQCEAWNDFRASLNGSFTRITIRGSLDPVGVTCDGPEANTLCGALHDEVSVNLSCDGRQWNVGVGCTNGGFPGTAMEISADGSFCSCSDGPTVRPCINNPNWGGMDINPGINGINDTCGAQTQTLEVICE